VPAEPVERRLKGEFAPDMAGHKHRPEVPRRNRLHVLAPHQAIRRGIAVQQPHQLVQVEMRRQQVAPAEIENGAVACLAVLAIGFDHRTYSCLTPLPPAARTTRRNMASSETCPCQRQLRIRNWQVPICKHR
jgi:hypothetical protein